MPENKKEDSSGQPELRVFLSFTETQEYLRVSHATIYRLMKQGLPSHKIGKKRIFLKDDLLNWIKDH
jgi:excisionase family DNA binding protein